MTQAFDFDTVSILNGDEVILDWEKKMNVNANWVNEAADNDYVEESVSDYVEEFDWLADAAPSAEAVDELADFAESDSTNYS